MTVKLKLTLRELIVIKESFNIRTIRSTELSYVARHRHLHHNHPPWASPCVQLLPTMPRLSVDRVCAAVQTTFPTANAAVKLLQKLGILTELTGQKKNRTFSYAAYVEMISQPNTKSG